MSILDIVSSASNALLRLDPETLEKLEPFQGKVFCLDLLEPEYTLYLRPSAQGFDIQNSEDLSEPINADVTLKGSLWSFIRMAKSGQDSDVFHSGRIQMSGDAELGQAFQSVLSQIDIDWEELLSKAVGDLAARKANSWFSDVSEWFKSSQDTARTNAGEILQEELHLTPAKIEVEDFTDEVEELRSAVARLEARIKQLQKK